MLVKYFHTLLVIVGYSLAVGEQSKPIWENTKDKLLKIQKSDRMIKKLSENGAGANQISSRDSYRDAATEFGYEEAQEQVGSSMNNGYLMSSDISLPFPSPSAYYYQITPEQTHSGNYYGNSQSTTAESEEGWLCGAVSGMCDDGKNRQDQGAQILGIFGLIALIFKKLQLIKFTPLLPLLLPFLPIIVPILIIIAIPLFIAAFFLPVIPVVVVGRALTTSMIHNFREILVSEACLERISCEVSKISTGIGFQAPWVHEFLDKASPKSKWIEKISSGGRSAKACSAYSCHPVSVIQRSIELNSEHPVD